MNVSHKDEKIVKVLYLFYLNYVCVLDDTNDVGARIKECSTTTKKATTKMATTSYSKKDIVTTTNNTTQAQGKGAFVP